MGELRFYMRFTPICYSFSIMITESAAASLGLRRGRGSGSGERGALSGDRILWPELRKVSAESAGKLSALESGGELTGRGDALGPGRSCLAGDQPGEDGALGHLEALRDGRDPGKRGREPGDVGLHVREQLLELVEHLVQDGVGRLVTGQALLREVLVGLGQALDLEKTHFDQF